MNRCIDSIVSHLIVSPEDNGEDRLSLIMLRYVYLAGDSQFDIGRTFLYDRINLLNRDKGIEI